MTLLHRSILVWLLISIPLPGLAQENSVWNLPGDILDDLIATPTQENAWWLLTGTGFTFLAHEIEDPEGAVRALDRGFVDKMVDFGNIYADGRVQVPLAIGCWAFGSWQDHDELAGLGYDLSRGLLLNYAVIAGIKHTVQRTRPSGGPLSFPSGHTATAFMTAGVLSRRNGGWIGRAGVGLGVLTALGRLEDNKHYASDVVAGATIGWIIGRTVGREGSEDSSAWRVVPSGNGLVLVGRF